MTTKTNGVANHHALNVASLEGRKILVTGAGSGIGAATAELAAAAGASVAVNDIDADRAEQISKKINDVGGTAFAVPGDVASQGNAESVVERSASVLGGLNGLVNNAGIHRNGAVLDVVQKDWDEVMQVNLLGPFYCSRAAHPHLRESGGSIVNVASIAASFPFPNAGSYNITKAGLVALTRQCALEWGADGIRANAVNPGMISGTNIRPPGASIDSAEVQNARGEIVPLRRTGVASDIAQCVVFLLSDSAGYVTGQSLFVDGGLSAALSSLLPK
jgi:NAD(P)-dependent dehydrogenase (short-subunit alcohol dehydrogenase family)